MRQFFTIERNANPAHRASQALSLIHIFDCSKVHIFAEDEWADDQGNIAPITYEAGFVHSMIKYLYELIDPKLRMPMENVHFPTLSLIHIFPSTP